MSTTKEEKQKKWMEKWERQRQNKWKFVAIAALKSGIGMAIIMFFVYHYYHLNDHFWLRWIVFSVLYTLISIRWGFYLFKLGERKYQWYMED